MTVVYIYLSNAAEQEARSGVIGLLDWKMADIVAYAAKYREVPELVAEWWFKNQNEYPQ